MYLTAGMYIRKGFRAREDAGVVANLRNAGAIPIALTNVPEVRQQLTTTLTTTLRLTGFRSVPDTCGT